MEQFGPAREQLYQKVEADPTNAFLMTALSYADLARAQGRKHRGRAACHGDTTISEAPLDGPQIASGFALLCARANQVDVAFKQVTAVIQIPYHSLTYGDLKTNPGWDPLRKDPLFEKLLAELAPRD